MPDPGARLGRRAVLKLGAAASAGAGLSACVPQPDRPARVDRPTTSPSSPVSAPRDYATRAAFDWADARYIDAATRPGSVANDAGGLAWGTAYLLQAYATMFAATADPAYLEKLVTVGQDVLALRDSERGVRDHLGEARPVWSSAGSYTARWFDLRTSVGEPVVRLRSLARGEAVTVDVRAAAGGSFDLTVRASRGGPEERLPGLSLDPAAPRYLVSFLEASSPTATELTAVDLRSPAAGLSGLDEVVRSERGPMIPYRYAFAAHTAMITAPLVEGALRIRADPQLRDRLGGPAEGFVEAARAALLAHGGEWVRYDDGAALYGYPRGTPVRGDGTPLPHNQYLAVARAHLQLFRATRDRVHADRAGSMLQVFRSDLGPGGTPVWPYYWSGSAAFRGFGPGSQISSYSPAMPPYHALEDTSHGALDIECLLLGHLLGLGPTEAELSRLASTFLRRVAARTASGEPTSHDSLDARGDRSRYDLSVPRWVGLARWDRRVRAFARELINHRAPRDVGAETLASMAALVAQP